MTNTIASTKIGDGTTGLDDTPIGTNTASPGSFTTLAASGAVTFSGATTSTGLRYNTPTIVAAAGATQGDATLIASSTVVITVTASTQGVKLPVAATGLTVAVYGALLLNINVYPNTGGTIGTGATNAAVVLAAAKSNVYFAENTTSWRVLTGA